jgi:hypothetical protein
LGTVFIDNIGGAAGSLGAAQVARAAPDGHTLLLGGTLTHTNEALLKTRPLYNPEKDLEPIMCLAVGPLAIAVHPSIQAATLKELVAYAKANPGKLSYGHSGVGLPFPTSLSGATPLASSSHPNRFNEWPIHLVTWAKSSFKGLQILCGGSVIGYD